MCRVFLRTKFPGNRNTVFVKRKKHGGVGTLLGYAYRVYARRKPYTYLYDTAVLPQKRKYFNRVWNT